LTKSIELSELCANRDCRLIVDRIQISGMEASSEEDRTYHMIGRLQRIRSTDFFWSLRSKIFALTIHRAS
jgi:hypothetical protein